MENSAQQSQVPELSHAMVGFLGIVCRNNLATYFVHSFLACEKRDKKLEVSYKHFSGPAEKAVPARHGCPSVTQHPPGPGGLTQPLGKNSPCRETLWASDWGSPHRTASSRYICSLTGKQHNLIYHLTRTKFPTLFPPVHYQRAPAPTSVSFFPQSHVDCFIEKIFPEVFVETPLWRQSTYNSNATFGVFFQLLLYFSWLLRAHEHSPN